MSTSQELKICPLLSLTNSKVNQDSVCTCDRDCALAVLYFQTTEGISHPGYVCALAAKYLLDDEGRLKV